MNEVKNAENEVIENIAINDLVDDFINSLDVKESSRKTYRTNIKPFIKWLMDTGLIDRLNTISREDILNYKKELMKKDLSVYSINSYITAVRSFFKWLESKKIYPNIASDIKGLKKPKGYKKDCLTVEQVRQALDSIDTDTLTGKRNYALFNLIARTGLRTIEVKRAKEGDIKQESGKPVLYIQGKGRDSKDNFVLLTDESLKPIRSYLAAREQEGEKITEDSFLFTSHNYNKASEGLTRRSIRRVIKRILKGIGLNTKRYSAHSLRHTAITLAIQGGASLEQAQAMARHSDPKTTMIYFHNLNRIENAAEKKINF